MNVITSNRSVACLHSNKIAVPVDPELYKFISIILDSKRLGSICEEKKVVIWLKEIDAEVDVKLKDESQVRKFIFPILRLEPTSSQKKIQKRQRVALLYAKILKQYVPEEDGCITLSFNYFELVSVVKSVFENHIQKNKDLFSRGILLSVESKKFCAQVEGDRVCIIPRFGNFIGKGGYGEVSEVYEIATRQFCALKESVQSERGYFAIEIETCILKMLHARAKKAGNLSVEGLQAPPFATFKIKSQNECPMVGFIGPKYGVDLYEWTQGNHENAERIAICKFLMCAFENKTKLEFWHGDIKLQNILIDKTGCVIIDWAGSLTFQEAVGRVSIPNVFSTLYTNSFDKTCIREILSQMRSQKQEDAEMKRIFIERAQSSELFSMAMVLFMILVPYMPFQNRKDSQYPDTEVGILQNSLEMLNERNYSKDIIQTITKMLAHFPEHRYSIQEAIEIWEKIG